MTDLSPVVNGWTHGCDALLQNITLWIPRCPHCGKPAPANAAAPAPRVSAEDDFALAHKAATLAAEACKSASGARISIERYVNITQIAHDAVASLGVGK
jgi:hypothetical protein